jgi:hypothetical protein
MNPLMLLLAVGGGLVGSLLSGAGKKQTEEPDKEAPGYLGEYPGGMHAIETLTPQQKEIMNQLMSYMMPRLGLSGQAFGQNPAGTTAQPTGQPTGQINPLTSMLGVGNYGTPRR